MTAAAWSAGLACVGVLLATVWRMRHSQPKPEPAALTCTRCEQYLGDVTSSEDLVLV